MEHGTRVKVEWDNGEIFEGWLFCRTDKSISFVSDKSTPVMGNRVWTVPISWLKEENVV